MALGRGDPRDLRALPRIVKGFSFGRWGGRTHLTGADRCRHQASARLSSPTPSSATKPVGSTAS